MTDSIPQQAGPGAGADLRRVEHVLWTLLEHNTLHFGDRHSTVTHAREALNEVRSILSHLAAPLAVEDSRERCASSDAKDAARYRWLKMTAPPGSPYQIHQNMLAAKRLIEAYEVFCTSWTQWDEHIDAAMAAASSGKEN